MSAAPDDDEVLDARLTWARLRAEALRAHVAAGGADLAAATSLEVAAAAAATRLDATRGTLARLARTFGLDDRELDAVWMLVAVALCPHVRDALLAVEPGLAGGLTVGTLQRLAYRERERGRAWRDLGATGRLRRLALVDASPSTGGDVRVRASHAVIAAALGEVRLDPDVAAVVAAVDPSEATAMAEVVPEVLDAIAVVAHGPRGLVAIQGRPRSGRGAVAQAFIAATGRTPLSIDAAAVTRAKLGAADLWRRVARDARWLGATPIVRNLDALAAGDDGDAALAALDEAFAEHDGPLLATTGVVLPPWTGRRALVGVELRAPSAAARARLWAAWAPELDDGARAQLVAAYPLAPSLLREVIVGARARGEVSAVTLRLALRASMDHALAGTATRMATSVTWDELVLTEDQHGRLADLVARVRGRDHVLDAWGLRQTAGRAVGVAALFSGPPGTGKTLAAQAFASALGLDLYQVDLSRIVSKWMGETEKQLAALFDAAEAGHAVLLFDEADALFARRTAVTTSNDRSANREVNYLLQRLEAFTGVCLLTTNHDASLDDAMRRRLADHLQFAAPGAAERHRLWQRLLPAGLPRVGEFDLRGLARRFDLAGGHIKNAVLRAAFVAADEGRALVHDDLVRAATLEAETLGRLAA